MEGVTHTCADPGSCSDRPGVGWVGSESSADRPAWLSWEPWLGHVLQRKSFGEKHEALVTKGCSEPPPVLPSTPSNVRLAVSERCLFGSPGYLQVAFPQALGSEACATTPDFGPDILSLSDEGTVASKGAPEASQKGTRPQGGTLHHSAARTHEPQVPLASSICGSQLYGLTQAVLWLVVDLSCLIVP